MGEWSQTPLPGAMGRIDQEGTVYLSRKVTHDEHCLILANMAIASGVSGLPYQLAPGTCEECG